MIKTQTFVMGWPPSVNRYWLRSPRGMYLSPVAREYKIEEAIKHAHSFPQRIQGFVEVHLRLYPPDARKRDGSNILKCLEDALEGFAIEDDAQIRSERWEFSAVDREKPCVVVAIITGREWYADDES